jgi:hypothetical protein
MTISYLPNEMLLHIFSFVVDATDLCHASQVCKEWYAVSREQTLWDRVVFHSKKSLDETDDLLDFAVQENWEHNGHKRNLSFEEEEDTFLGRTYKKNNNYLFTARTLFPPSTSSGIVKSPFKDDGIIKPKKKLKSKSSSVEVRSVSNCSNPSRSQNQTLKYNRLSRVKSNILITWTSKSLRLLLCNKVQLFACWL